MKYLAIFTLLVLWTASPVVAQTPPDQTSSVEEATMEAKEGTGAGEIEATETAKKKADYQLPYAGILPDHPLYIIKTIRDRIMDFLITDPFKKAEFTLLAADKRIVAAAALVDKGKGELAESTASKGEAYLVRSLKIAEERKLEDTQKTALVAKLKSALAKHEEILRSLADKTEGTVKARFTAMANEAASNRQSL